MAITVGNLGAKLLVLIELILSRTVQTHMLQHNKI